MSMENEIKSVIVAFIRENFLFDDDGTGLDEEESLLESGVIDSTGILEIVQFLEEKYAFQVEDEEITPENLDSVANISRFVAQKMSSDSRCNQAQSQ